MGNVGRLTLRSDGKTLVYARDAVCWRLRRIDVLPSVDVSIWSVGLKIGKIEQDFLLESNDRT